MLLFVLDGIAYPLLVWLRRGPGAAVPRSWPTRASAGRWPRWAAAPRIGSLCDRAVGHDARAGGQRGGAARDLGAVRGAAGHVAAEGEASACSAPSAPCVIVAGVMALRFA